MSMGIINIILKRVVSVWENLNTYFYRKWFIKSYCWQLQMQKVSLLCWIQSTLSARTYGYYIKRVSGILFKSSLVCQGIRMVYGCLEGGRAQATAWPDLSNDYVCCLKEELDAVRYITIWTNHSAAILHFIVGLAPLSLVYSYGYCRMAG